MRALALLLLASCAYYEDRVADVGSLLAPVDERVIHGDTDFTPRERAAAEKSCLEYQTFTRGRVRLSVVWDIDELNYVNPPTPVLYRAVSGGTEGGSVRGDRMWWFPDKCPDLQACIMHEYGHLLGLDHFATPGHVMSAHNPVHRFGPLDYAECERVGVCRDRKLDVTTVTVTTDPAIPNVWPEYPAR